MSASAPNTTSPVVIVLYDTDEFLRANVYVTGGPRRVVSGTEYERTRAQLHASIQDLEKAPVASDQMRAHQRAIAVLGPKRGRWK